MDVWDAATAVEEREREAAIKAARARRALEPTGTCHNCGEPAPAGLFCEPGCRDDWQRQEAARARNGGAVRP